MRFIWIYLILLISNVTFAAESPEKIQKDTVQIGKSGSATNKSLEFLTSDGLKKALGLDNTTKNFSFDSSLSVGGALSVTGAASSTGNLTSNANLTVDGTSNLKGDVTLGSGVGSDKKIIVNKGGTNPFIKWDNTKGKWVYSNDSVVEKAIGSGGGGAGAISILENGGFEDGINVQWEYTASRVTAQAGANALYQEGSALFDPTAQNDYLRTTYLTVPKALRGSACEARFIYIGGDVNYSAQVEDQSGNVLGTYNNGVGANVLPAHPEVGYESVFFICPSPAKILAAANNGNIRLVIKQGTVTNAAAMTIGDVHLGGLIGLVESTTPDFDASYVLCSGASSFDTGSKFIQSVSNISSSMCTITWKPGVFTTFPYISLTDSSSSGSFLSLDVVTANATSAVIRCRTSSNAACGAYSAQVIVGKNPVDAKQSVQVYKSIPKIAQNVNSISNYVDLNGSTLFRSSSGINTSRSSTGIYTLTFDAGIYTTQPLCNVTPDIGASVTAVTVSNFPANIQIYTRLSNTAAAYDSGFMVTCHKSGTDSKLPTVQPIIIGQVINSAAETGLNNVRIEACRINNNGSASIDVNSGLCAGWINSVSFGGVGEVGVIFKPNIFLSGGPVCAANALPGSPYTTVNCFIRDTLQSGSGVVECETSSTGANVNIAFNLICVGRR